MAVDRHYHEAAALSRFRQAEQRRERDERQSSAAQHCHAPDAARRARKSGPRYGFDELLHVLGRQLETPAGHFEDEVGPDRGCGRGRGRGNRAFGFRLASGITERRRRQACGGEPANIEERGVRSEIDGIGVRPAGRLRAAGHGFHLVDPYAEPPAVAAHPHDLAASVVAPPRLQGMKERRRVDNRHDLPPDLARAEEGRRRVRNGGHGRRHGDQLDLLDRQSQPLAGEGEDDRGLRHVPTSAHRPPPRCPSRS